MIVTTLWDVVGAKGEAHGRKWHAMRPICPHVPALTGQEKHYIDG